MKWTLTGLKKLSWLNPILLRGYIGYSFFCVHGMDKVRPKGTWDWGQAFASAGSPQFLYYIAAWTEFLAGLALLLGLLTRWAAVGLAGVMLYAVFKIHWSAGFPLQDGGFEVAGLYAVGCLVLAKIGPGWLSLDRLFFGKDAL
jgi:putative oxidoreductase